MKANVSLRTVVDELDSLLDGFTSYLNRQTGEVYSVRDEEADSWEDYADIDDLPEWQRKQILIIRQVRESEDWFELPGKFEIHEWSIMDEFSRSVPNDYVRNELMDAIHERGAFRRFRNTIERYGLRDSWHQFRMAALEQIAIAWLENNGIGYERDTDSETPRVGELSVGSGHIAVIPEERMEIIPVKLEGTHVSLEPLSAAHEEALNIAAADGKLWNSKVTIVPSRDKMGAYIASTLNAQAQGRELPFVIIRKSSGQIVGCTRFFHIERDHRRVEIGYTWLAASAQRTAVNTEAKLLLLTHAFENWRCIRVEFFTDVLNEQSRAAILRLGAKQEGILRNHMIMPSGRYRDSVCFSIVEAEWSEVKTRLATKLMQSSLDG